MEGNEEKKVEKNFYEVGYMNWLIYQYHVIKGAVHVA